LHVCRDSHWHKREQDDELHWADQTPELTHHEAATLLAEIQAYNIILTMKLLLVR
jgi:hypothetical protein